ncbi:MAG: 4Fe-4S binding protein [Armatimonadia bacterium]
MYRPPRWLYSRWYVQLVSFVFANSLFLSRFKGFCYPVLNCWACPSANFACPIGALQNSAGAARLSLLGGSSWWAVIPLYVLGTLLFFSALFGRMMCGWLCPFGWFQELLGRRAVRRSPRWSWYVRYLVLAVLVFIIPFLTSEAWFSKLCPMGAIEGAIPQPLLHPELRAEIGWLWYLKISLMVIILAWAVFYRRPFCNVICPLGAIFSLFHRYSAWRIDYERSKCTDCMYCIKICPQGIDPRRDLNGHACIGCLECEKCPYDAIHSRPMWNTSCGTNNFCRRDQR